MQITSPFVCETVLIFALSQNKKLSMIIKTFVALGFVMKIDDTFAAYFPGKMQEIAKKVKLIIGKD